MSTIGAQDIRRRLAANGGQNIMAQGTFVFFKSGAARVAVTINNETVTMEPGDVRRTVEPFTSFEIQNTTGIEQDVELVAGFGDYNRLIVRGDISSFPAVLGSDGVPRPDSRQEFTFSLGMTEPGNYSFEAWDDMEILAVAPSTGAEWSGGDIYNTMRTAAGDTVLLEGSPNDGPEAHTYSATSGALMGTANKADIQSVMAHPEFGWVGMEEGSLNDFKGFHQMGDNGEKGAQLAVNPGRGVGSIIYGCFLPNGYLAFWGYKNVDGGAPDNQIGIVIMDGMGGEVIAFQPKDQVRGGAYQFNFQGGLFLSPDLTSNSHLFLHDGSTVLRIKWTDWSEEIITTSAPAFAHFQYDYQRNEYIGITGSRVVKSLATKAADYWGNGKLIDHQTGGGIFFHESERLEKDIAISGQDYDDLARIWKVGVIGVILRLWYAQQKAGDVPANYLDYVHKIQVNGRTLADTAYESFERAKKTDLFRIPNPATITLTITEELIP